MNIIGIIVLILSQATCAELIKRGDFQFYSYLIFTTMGSQLVVNISSNTLYWYDKSFGTLQIKKMPSRYTTLVVDLSNSAPMTLCQNVSLTIGELYNLSYGLYSPYYSQNMIGKAYINDILVTSMTIPDPDTFSTQYYVFNASFSNNVICFNQTHDAAPYYFYYYNRGGFIDNISLVLVNLTNSTQNQSQTQNFTTNSTNNTQNNTQNQTQKITIPLYFQINQIQQTVTLKSNVPYSDQVANKLMNQYILVFEQKNLSFTAKADENGKLYLIISVNSSLALNQINFQKIIYQNSSIQLEVFIQMNTSVNKFIYLDGKYRNLMNETKNALFFINEGLTQATSFSRIAICSYFINMVLDFQILSLYYVFLQISIVPDFTKNIYYEILGIVYSSSGILDYLQGLFPEILTFIQFNPQEKIPQRINVEKNSQPWFGTYGISSHIINSNIQNIFSLVWLFLRLILLKLIIKMIFCCVSQQKKMISKLRFRFCTVVLAQFCYMTPNLIISIFHNITSSNENSSQFWYQAANILLFYLSLISLFMYSLIPKMKVKKQKEKVTQNRKIKILKKKPKIKIKLKITYGKSLKQILSRKQSENENFIQKYFSHSKYSEQAFSIPIFFTIPFLLCIGIVQLFLVINSIMIILRLIGIFIYKTKKSSKIKKALQFLSSIIWLVHHTIFTAFFIIQKKQLYESNFNFIIILGIMAIFTVFIGLVLEIIKLIILFVFAIKGIVKIIINVIKKCRSRAKQQNQKQKQKQDHIKQDISPTGSLKQKQQADYIMVQQIQKKKKSATNDNRNPPMKYIKSKKKTQKPQKTYSNISKLMLSCKSQTNECNKKQRTVKIY